MISQFDVASRNAALDAMETTWGASPTLEIRTGAPPANTAAADAGTILASMVLPADFMANASGGVKALSGSWAATAVAAGNAGHFRIKSAGGTVRAQGDVSNPAGDGALKLVNISIAVDQPVSISSFTITAGGD